MKSITGIEYNNPAICIKGNGNFACVCKECIEEIETKTKQYLDELFGPTTEL